MQHSVDVARIVLLGGFMVMVLNSIGVQTVSAAGSQINVAVCSGTSSSATLTVDSPQSDSVVGVMPLTISGTVTNVSQIDISVDGVYNNTAAISSSGTTYTTQLQLTQGTHTITLVGNDVCSVQNPSQSIVVTYQPASPPSSGGQTPTTIGPVTPSAGSPGTNDTSDRFETISNIPVIGELPEVVGSIARAVDLDTTARDGLIRAMIRFALFTLGLGLLLFGAAIAKYIRDRYRQEAEVEGYIEGSTPASSTIMHHAVRNSWGIRALGLILLIGAFNI